MSSVLEADFIDMEVKKALFKMDSNKVPGPDGFLAVFFPAQLEYCWSGF